MSSAMGAAIGRIMDVAEQINAACDAKQVDAGTRARMHGYHGEMVVRGASADDVMRVVNSALEHYENRQP